MRNHHSSEIEANKSPGDDDDDDDVVLTNFIVTSDSSLSIMRNKWFRKLLQRRIKPCCPTTLASRIKDQAKAMKASLVRRLMDVDNICLIADGWKNPFGDNMFGIAAVFLSDSFEICEVPLYVKVVHTHATTGDDLCSAVRQTIADGDEGYQIENKVRALTVDGGSSSMMRGARLAHIPRIYCMNHLLSLAVHDFLECEWISPLFQKCRQIMDWYQRNDADLIQFQTDDEVFEPFEGRKPTRIHSYATFTRWLTVSELLNSIVFNLNAIAAMLKHKDRARLIIPEDAHQLLHETALFMYHIRGVQLQIENADTSSFATLYSVFMNIRRYIEQQITSVTTPTDFTRALQVFYSGLHQRYIAQHLSDTHYLALMMHPIHKDLEHFTDSENSENVKERIRGVLFNSFRAWVTDHVEEVEMSTQEASYVNPLLITNQVPRRKGPEDELQQYLDTKVNPHTFSSALHWWRENMEAFPTVARFARQFLVLQGSSAFIERLWSRGKGVCTDKLSRMSDETLESLIFLKGNIDIS